MIPKSQVFRFENYWMHHKDFKAIVQNAWNIPVGFHDSAKKINAKFKNVRRGLKIWAKKLPCLKAQICNVNATIDLLDVLEEMRTLTILEWNLRDLLKNLIISLLQDQNAYWKQRGKLNGLSWVMRTQNSFIQKLP